jgi:CelD/BcsL family acetyltransferase involved in cellulose biosynthesis
VSYWCGTRHSGTFAVGTPGYDPRFASDSVGRYTMMRMVEDLCADPEVHLLDFGQGEAEYKDAFARPDRREEDLWFFAPRPRAVATGTLLSGLDAVNRGGRAVVRRSEAARRLRRAERSRVAAVPEPVA